MIVKKLAVPLINEKLLMQAEHCYVATASISDAGFDFIRSRIPPKCKMEILTGLDAATSPGVLKRIWKHYQERISLHIYTKNFFHANLYIFDLPFRKSVAFVGSGQFTLEGLKDNEELFYKIIDAKEIEALKSWYTGYYEFAEPLNEALIQEYDLIYPELKLREIESKQEKREVIDLTTRGFNWEAIKFKNQYFKKEDYLTFSNSKVSLNTPEIQTERENVRAKMLQLHELINGHVSALKLHKASDVNQLASSIHPSGYSKDKVRSIAVAYGRRDSEILKYYPEATLRNLMTIQIAILQKEFSVLLVPGAAGKGKEDREYFKHQINEAEYRATFFKLLTGLGAGYWIEIFGDRKSVETFQNEDTLWEFTKADDWRHYAFMIGKKYSPDDPEISNDKIAPTIEKEFDKLVMLYNHIKRQE